MLLATEEILNSHDDIQLMNVSPELEAIIQNVNDSGFLRSLQIQLENYNIINCCNHSYNFICKNINIVELADSCIQGSAEWRLQRKFRLTGNSFSHYNTLARFIKLTLPLQFLVRVMTVAVADVEHMERIGVILWQWQPSLCERQTATECQVYKSGFYST